jgi:hypothetical protein
MTGFLKLAADRAYATGGIRSNLGTADLVAKLRRAGLAAACERKGLVVRCGDEEWSFSSWQADGVGRIWWIETKALGDVSGLSDRLARAGIRHRFEYSRPRDLETNEIRSVTRYEYRWDQPGLPPPGERAPDITMFDEQV